MTNPSYNVLQGDVSLSNSDQLSENKESATGSALSTPSVSFSSFSASAASLNSNSSLTTEAKPAIESLWSPSSMVEALSGFHPEEGLEYSWTPDDSSAGVSAATDGSSIHSSNSRTSTTGQLIYDFSGPKLKSNSSACSSHSKAKLANYVEADETRESTITVENDEIQVREENCDGLSSTSEEIIGEPGEDSWSPNQPSSSLTCDDEMKQRETLPVGPKPELTEKLEDDKLTCPRELPAEHEASVEISLVEASVEISLVDKVTVPRMKRLKKAVRKSIFGCLLMKSRKKKSSSCTPVAKDCNEQASQSTSVAENPSPPTKSPPSIPALFTSQSTEECSEPQGVLPALNDAQSRDENHDHVSSDILPADSTFKTSNAPPMSKTLEKVGVATVQQLVPREDKVDFCLMAVGLGCLVVP